MKIPEKETARRGRTVEFDEVDEEFMRDYGLTPEQMRLIQAAYRREVIHKAVIGVLLAIIAALVFYVVYFDVR